MLGGFQDYLSLSELDCKMLGGNNTFSDWDGRIGDFFFFSQSFSVSF